MILDAYPSETNMFNDVHISNVKPPHVFYMVDVIPVSALMHISSLSLERGVNKRPSATEILFDILIFSTPFIISSLHVATGK